MVAGSGQNAFSRPPQTLAQTAAHSAGQVNVGPRARANRAALQVLSNAAVSCALARSQVLAKRVGESPRFYLFLADSLLLRFLPPTRPRPGESSPC